MYLVWRPFAIISPDFSSESVTSKKAKDLPTRRHSDWTITHESSGAVLMFLKRICRSWVKTSHSLVVVVISRNLLCTQFDSDMVNSSPSNQLEAGNKLDHGRDASAMKCAHGVCLRLINLESKSQVFVSGCDRLEIGEHGGTKATITGHRSQNVT